MIRLSPRSIRRQCGLTMLEILVTLVISAFGLLGLAAFVTRSAAATFEANQRARATALLKDMESRIRNNKTDAASYASATTYGAAVTDCAGAANGAALDLCQWNNQLAGANDELTAGGGLVEQGFRGCVTQPSALVFVVTVAWGASALSVPPDDPCGKDLFGDDGFRRVIRTQVRVATLAA